MSELPNAETASDLPVGGVDLTKAGATLDEATRAVLHALGWTDDREVSECDERGFYFRLGHWYSIAEKAGRLLVEREAAAREVFTARHAADPAPDPTVGQLSDAVQTHLAIRWHEDKCDCGGWPRECASDLWATRPRTWDTMAVLGATRELGYVVLTRSQHQAEIDGATKWGRELAARAIAYRIRAELVCCDVYDRDAGTDRAGFEHAICFWGEAGARIAEDGGLGPDEEGYGERRFAATPIPAGPACTSCEDAGTCTVCRGGSSSEVAAQCSACSGTHVCGQCSAPTPAGGEAGGLDDDSTPWRVSETGAHVVDGLGRHIASTRNRKQAARVVEEVERLRRDAASLGRRLALDFEQRYPAPPAEKPAPVGQTITMVCQGGPADGQIPGLRYDPGTGPTPVPGRFVEVLIAGTGPLVYVYDRCEVREGNTFWVYTPHGDSLIASGGGYGWRCRLLHADGRDFSAGGMTRDRAEETLAGHNAEHHAEEPAPADEFAEFDVTEAELDARMAEGEPVELITPLTFATESPIVHIHPPAPTSGEGGQ